MKGRLPLMSIVLLALALAACGPRADAEASRLPAAAQAADSAAAADAPAGASDAVSNRPLVAPGGSREACPVTASDSAFAPPSPYPATAPYAGEFWYGADALWTMLSVDGTWRALPHSDTGYTQKVFWWRDGYDWQTEPEPELTVTGRRLDDSAPPLVASPATNAYHPDFDSAMLVGVEIPTSGCWEIAGRVEDSELSFVVWVEP